MVFDVHDRAFALFQTPQELVSIGDCVGFDGAALAQTSRLVAKVDSAAVQVGVDLYLHGFIVTDDGRWTVVQQGMNGERGQGAALSLDIGRIDDLPQSPETGLKLGALASVAKGPGREQLQQFPTFMHRSESCEWVPGSAACAKSASNT